MLLRRILGSLLTTTLVVGAVTATTVASPMPASAATTTRLFTPNAAATTLSVATPGDAVLVKFQGVTGQVVNIFASNGTFAGNCDATLTVRTPAGVAVGAAACAGQTGGIAPVTLTASGKWQVLFDPVGTAVGSITFRITSTAGPQTITTGASAVDVVVGATSSLDLAFGASVGKFVTAFGQNTDCTLVMDLLAPTLGTMGSSCNAHVLGFIDQVPVFVSGLHHLRLTNTTGTPQHFVVRADLNTDVALTTTIDGPSQRPPTTGLAQNILLSFSATAGQSVHLSVGSPTFASVVVQLRAPNGGAATSDVFSAGRTVSTTRDVKLDATGTWTYVLDPVGTTVGTATLQVVTVPDPTMLQIGGVARRTTFTAAGDGTFWPFDAVAGHRIAIQFTNTSVSCSSPVSCIFGSVVAPGASTPAATFTVPGTGTNFAEVFVTVTGRWSLLLTGGGSGTVDVRLVDVPDTTGTVQYGVARSVAITAPVQRARLSLSATNGDRVSMLLSAFATTRNLVTITWIRPDGTTLATQTLLSPAQGFSNPRTLDATGTWTVEVDLPGADTGSLTMLLTRVVDLTGGLLVGGSGQTLVLNQPGQVARLAFNRNSGTRFRVRTATSTFSLLPIRVIGPLGTIVQSCTVSVASPNCALANAVFSGAYTIVVDPTSAQTGSVFVSVTAT